MKRSMIVLLSVTVLIFGALFGLKAFGNKKMNEFFDNMPIPPVGITTASARAEDWQNRLNAVGSLQAVHGIEVTTQTAGQVQKILFESGQRVRVGDVLLVLDSATESADLESLEAQVNLAERTLTRQERLFGLDAVSRSGLDEARASAASLKAQAQAQRARIAQKTIRAPFDGELGIREINLGQYLNPGDPIVPLQALDPIYVDFTLPERELARVQPGFPVEMSVDAWPDTVFTGRVLALEPQVDTSTRSFKLRAEVSNAESRLRPGSYAKLVLSVPGERKVITVPRSAVSYNAYGDSVFVVHESEPAPGSQEKSLKVRQRFVKTGEMRGDFVEIRGGVSEGEVLATSALFRLGNDTGVIVDNSAAPTPAQGATVTGG